MLNLKSKCNAVDKNSKFSDVLEEYSSNGNEYGSSDENTVNHRIFDKYVFGINGKYSRKDLVDSIIERKKCAILRKRFVIFKEEEGIFVSLNFFRKSTLNILVPCDAAFEQSRPKGVNNASHLKRLVSSFGWFNQRSISLRLQGIETVMIKRRCLPS